MQLWLIRHAIAEERRRDLDDAARALTPRGRERFRRGVRGLRHLGVRFECVVHSPLLRAVQTAQLLEPLLERRGGEFHVSASLARPPSEALLSEIGGERVALVGHEPWLSELACWLITGWRPYSGPQHAPWIELGKGGAALLEGELAPGSMQLLALHRPRTLRRL